MSQSCECSHPNTLSDQILEQCFPHSYLSAFLATSPVLKGRHWECVSSRQRKGQAREAPKSHCAKEGENWQQMECETRALLLSGCWHLGAGWAHSLSGPAHAAGAHSAWPGPQGIPRYPPMRSTALQGPRMSLFEKFLCAVFCLKPFSNSHMSLCHLGLLAKWEPRGQLLETQPWGHQVRAQGPGGRPGAALLTRSWRFLCTEAELWSPAAWLSGHHPELSLPKGSCPLGTQRPAVSKPNN